MYKAIRIAEMYLEIGIKLVNSHREVIYCISWTHMMHLYFYRQESFSLLQLTGL